MAELDLASLAGAYRRDGFVAVEGLLDGEAIQALNADAVAIARGDHGPVIGAAPAAGRSDSAIMNDILAIHFPHKASPLMRAAMAHPALVSVLTALIGPNVKAMQTMMFVKRAGMAGQAWHQDEFFIPTRDRSLCGAWIALDDAVIENGCLWMQPGSQAPGVIWPMKPHSDPRFDASQEAYGHPYPRESGVPVELKAGGVAFFNGYVLHRSLKNLAPSGFRRALVIHYCSAETLLPWSIGLGPGQGRVDFRDIEMIAGEDPYEAKGRVDLITPFVRAEDPARAAETMRQVREATALRTGLT
ncbi:MAG TPA: phytanoyl-CoA dioxygenase family protein [Caulobacteraceae bacterium]|jgi:ectoine hydroxylase-related dioxygenase (phytanoyl-CoA dioxygenase family)|nr:phytanoyl-CoA dioxygenase family protein [Caulobacteraceae bacterium]